MSSNPTAAASHRDAVEPLPADHTSLQTPFVGGGVSAATGAGEAQGTVPASPEPVLISEHQVMFATAAAGAASRTAVIRGGWIVLLWQRLSRWPTSQPEPRSHYARLRPSYIEHAAMAREMERL